MVEEGHTADHSCDYNLVVIGGSSGDVVAAKEASPFGAKVACLDFATPSSMGTTWGRTRVMKIILPLLKVGKTPFPGGKLGNLKRLDGQATGASGKQGLINYRGRDSQRWVDFGRCCTICFAT